MYSTCLFCHTELGANEAVEHFPVGRRLAFDAAKGRLWVVCRKCERWNLTPIEERWEAIEECERSYRGTKLRASTDQIGLARLSEGLELVRIGSPLRPEFAAWRYGDQFGKRRTRQMATTGVLLAGAALVVPLGGVIGGVVGLSGLNILQAVQPAWDYIHRNRIVARLTGPDGRPVVLRRRHVQDAKLLRANRDQAWGVRLKHGVARNPDKQWWKYDSQTDTTVVHGEDALRIAAQILPAMNYKGASKRQLNEAVGLVEEHRDVHAFFRTAARTADRSSWFYESQRGTLRMLPSEILLALEMVSHEESERNALDGDLRILEEAWREAEEIAAISDDMFLPEEISSQLSEMKKGR